MANWIHDSELSYRKKVDSPIVGFFKTENEDTMKKNKITVSPPFLLIDKEIYDVKGRLVAKCWREDVAEILLVLLNSQHNLLQACKDLDACFDKAFFMSGTVNLPKVNKAKIKAKAAIAKATPSNHANKEIK